MEPINVHAKFEIGCFTRSWDNRTYPKKVGSPWMGFCSDGPLNVLAIFEIRSFSHSWDNRGFPKYLGSPWICPCFLFSKLFHGLLFGWTLLLFWPNLKFIALSLLALSLLSRERDNSNWNFGWGANPHSWGRGGRSGSGIVPFERAKASSYILPIVTFSLALCVSEILPLLCSGTPFFPTPPLVCPNFPMFPSE